MKACLTRAGMFLAACAFVIPASHAQMIASRDLTTGWTVPPEHVPGPASDACPQIHSSISDGQAASSNGPAAKSETPLPAPSEHLELEILEIVPNQLTIGGEFAATVRVKNAGTGEVLIPGVTDGNQLAAKPGTGADNKAEEKYEVADVSFRLATDKDHHAAIFLTSAGALFADPDDTKTYVTLGPGTWFELKLKGVVECGAAKCFGPLQPDGHGVLTAWWYQRVLSHTVKGCDEVHGAYTVRELNSVPFQVVVRNSVKKADNNPLI